MQGNLRKVGNREEYIRRGEKWEKKSENNGENRRKLGRKKDMKKFRRDSGINQKKEKNRGNWGIEVAKVKTVFYSGKIHQ